MEKRKKLRTKQKISNICKNISLIINLKCKFRQLSYSILNEKEKNK